MIKVKNERVILPVIRNPLANWTETKRLLMPLFQSFIESDIDTDKYEGWAFSMKFIKNSNVDYQEAISSMDMAKCISKNDWKFALSHKDRNESIWLYNDTAIVVHIESWLWFG